MARYALPEFEVHNDVDEHLDLELIITLFFTIKRNIFVFFRRLRGLRYWTGLTDCQREEFTSWVLCSNLREKIENTISILTQTLKNNDSFLNKCIGDIHTIALKHKKLR